MGFAKGSTHPTRLTLLNVAVSNIRIEAEFYLPQPSAFDGGAPPQRHVILALVSSIRWGCDELLKTDVRPIFRPGGAPRCSLFLDLVAIHEDGVRVSVISPQGQGRGVSAVIDGIAADQARVWNVFGATRQKSRQEQKGKPQGWPHEFTPSRPILTARWRAACRDSRSPSPSAARACRRRSGWRRG